MFIFEKMEGKRTQFYVDLIYGLAFIIGFIYLIFQTDPVIAAFEGGLVLGYFLHVWEKMISYEKALNEDISRKAEEQVSEQIEQKVPQEVQNEMEDGISEAVEDVEIEEKVEQEISEAVDDAIEEKVEEKVEKKDK